MSYSLGIDLGAGFTAVAIADEVGTHAAHLSPTLVASSAVYFSADGPVLTGEAAVRAGASDSSRLVRGFKKRLGDPTPLVVAGAQRTPEELMAVQLREVVAEVTEQQGEPPQSIALTYPVTWGPYRAEHFARVADLSGVEVSTIITEPVAAATHLSAKGELAVGDIVAIVDFGIDAVTVTLLRMSADSFDILGTPEEIDHAGSADFDEAMRTLLDQKLGGRISALDRTDPDDAALLVAIEDTCRAAKETLSMRKEATVSVALSDGAHSLVVTRGEFTRLIRPSVRRAVDALRRTVQLAELDEKAITSIVLTGGASRIPAIAEEFATVERPVRSVHHPKLIVALGAAQAAYTLAMGTVPAATAPAIPGREPSVLRSLWPSSRRRLIGLGAAGLVILAGLAAILIVPAVLAGQAQAEPQGQQTSQPASHTPAAPDTPAEKEREISTPAATPDAAPAGHSDAAYTVLADRENPDGLVWYIASAEADNSWGVASLDEGVATMPSIRLAAIGDGMRAQWSSPKWPSQFYAQLADQKSVDLSEAIDAKGALVFDLTVHSGSASSFDVAAHCTFPCAGSVDIAQAVAALSPDTTTQMIIPAQCFTSSGLDAAKVNTPFLLIGQGDIDVTVGEVHWEPLRGADADALTC